MKKIYLFFLSIFMVNLLMGQFNDAVYAPLEKKNRMNLAPGEFVTTSDWTGQFAYPFKIDYLRKSRTQKTFAWILTGVGVTIVTIGALTQDYVDAFTGIANEKNSASPVVYAVGGACIAGGIILFIASSKNKRKAVASSVYIDIENAPVLQAAAINYKAYPVLGLRLSFK